MNYKDANELPLPLRYGLNTLMARFVKETKRKYPLTVTGSYLSGDVLVGVRITLQRIPKSTAELERLVRDGKD